MWTIQEHYTEEVEKLLYEKCLWVALLFRESHEELGECIGAKYYKMMDGKSTKFCNELVIIWLKKIKSQLAMPPSLAN